jgi:transposase-like protein
MTARKWIRQPRIDAEDEEGLSTYGREELRRLPSDSRTLRMKRDLLKEPSSRQSIVHLLRVSATYRKGTCVRRRERM